MDLGLVDGTPRSMLVWLKNDSPGLQWAIFGQGRHQAGQMWDVCARSDSYGLGVWGEFRDVWMNIGSDLFPTGEWHHLAVTWNGADLCFYYDGSLYASQGPGT